MPTFSLLYSPPNLSVKLQPVHDAPLPMILANHSKASVVSISPVYLRREITRLVSYYALFE